ncbi:hypothetical protein HAX54_043963 [Datura stramonium]|uniref:Uncharacterized protein n=1 Tax=Datura stramonium TaxID=4076 RepID=A0ABS8W1U7_DATST|nr:hypothetical protein [Datura stramonium]
MSSKETDGFDRKLNDNRWKTKHSYRTTKAPLSRGFVACQARPNIDLLVDKTIVKVFPLLFSDDSKLSSSLSDKWEIYEKLQSLPRNSAPTRLHRRCRSSRFP